MEHRYDVVIIGSGIGGLICAELLGRRNLRVCVLEKNVQTGGSLQIFSRDKAIIDTGVHYLGGLAPGQNLYQVFRYLGLLDGLSLEPYPEAAFDMIVMEGEQTEYAFAQGYERFMASLSAAFPEEENNIRRYCAFIREVCSKFPMYGLRYSESDGGKSEVTDLDAETTIAAFTQNERLRAVLGGNNMLYAGKRGTPFHIHALILNSYIESSWKVIGGGNRIARLLTQQIRQRGGEVRTRAEVTRMVEQGGRIDHVVLSSGDKIHAKEFISAIHPASTLALTEGETLRPAYRHRIEALPNTVGCFSLYIVFKPNRFAYIPHNYYVHRPGQLWDMMEHTDADWPRGYALFFSRQHDDDRYAATMTVLTYMRAEEVEPWKGSHNTTAQPSARPAAYEDFKRRKAELLIHLMEGRFPGIRDQISSWHAATPLTYRDYIGDPDGSMYGLERDHRQMVQSRIAARTRIPNLFLTGQNLNVHGILGTTISALVTVRDMTGDDGFIDQIRNGERE
jgi:all-trans-retinol 13,14-reductase